MLMSKALLLQKPIKQSRSNYNAYGEGAIRTRSSA
jgi:hypothetical protein